MSFHLQLSQAPHVELNKIDFHRAPLLFVVSFLAEIKVDFC